MTINDNFQIPFLDKHLSLFIQIEQAVEVVYNTPQKFCQSISMRDLSFVLFWSITSFYFSVFSCYPRPIAMRIWH